MKIKANKLNRNKHNEEQKPKIFMSTNNKQIMIIKKSDKQIDNKQDNKEKI